MIGIFDSGIGGLTVVRALLERLPSHDIVYFGDTARTPYGNKSAQTVTAYAIENTEFLLNQGARMIVVACHTASSVATDAIRQKYDVPLFEVITPAVEYALRVSRTLNIGVIGTRGTITSGVYEREIVSRTADARVHSVACPLLVPLVEEGWLKRPETVMIVKKYLRPLKIRHIDTLILGCTHYPFLKGVIQRKAGKSVVIVDSAVSVSERIAAYLAENPRFDADLGKHQSLTLFMSDITDHFNKMAHDTLRRRIRIERHLT